MKSLHSQQYKALTELKTVEHGRVSCAVISRSSSVKMSVSESGLQSQLGAYQNISDILHRNGGGES